MADRLPNVEGDRGQMIEATPVVLVTQGGPLATTQLPNGSWALETHGAATESQAAQIISQNATIIANQTAIITLLQGGINVNVLNNGGL